MPRAKLPFAQALRRIVGIWALLVVVPTPPALLGDEPSLPPPDQIVARVGVEEISRAELTAGVHRLLELQGRPPETDHSPALEALVLEQLVDQRLVKAEIERSGIAVDDADVEARLILLQAQLASRPPARQAFQQAMDRDPAGMRQQLQREIALEKLLSSQLTPAVRQTVFDKHHRDFDGTTLRVSHIILRPVAGGAADSLPALQQRAEAIRSEISGGKLTFAAAAEKYSAGPSRHRGGDIGFIPRHSSLDEEFSRVAFSLEPGSISPPVLSPAGVHLLTITETQPGTLTMEQLRPQVDKLVARELLRQRVAGARQTTPISYSPGVPHFEADPAADPGEVRRVIVSPGATVIPATE